MTTKSMVCVAVQGEVNQMTAQETSNQSARTSGIISEADWPVALCGVTAVLIGEDGTRAQIEIHDWDDAPNYAEGNLYSVVVTKV